MTELPTGYALRSPRDSDAEGIVALVQAHDIADFGEPDFTAADLHDDWMRPRFDRVHDAWVVGGPTGRTVGYAYVWESQPDRELEADAYVQPEYAGRGLGGRLLELIEDRARSIAGGRAMTLGVFASSANAEKRNLLERRGFTAVRSVLRLRVDLSRRPEDEIELPAGFSVGPLDAASLESLRSVFGAAFAEHGRFTPHRMQEWLDSRFAHPAFEPSLCRVVRDGPDVVGAVMVFDVGETGYTSSVAIRPDRRGRGLGPALVRAAFAALRDRGQMRVVVSVDAEAEAGLLALYEAAGMRVHERHDLFVKAL
jgi:mycothiol synthase